jgi:hypothetical protein
MPARILDLYVEFRNHTNGVPTVAGNSLLGALAHFGIDGIGASEKDEMRNLVLRGGPWTGSEQNRILDYCAEDVVALKRLLRSMLPHIDFPRALYRGRYMGAVAAMEHNGVPLNIPRLSKLQEKWDHIKDQLITRIDADYQVFEGRTFKLNKFERWLVANNISWPRLSDGQLELKDDTFRQMSKVVPAVAPLRELRHALSEMRLNALSVGSDGRNRCMLSPFSSITGRNQPSNTRFIFGTAVWLRNLIQPPPSHGLAYIDWAQQEFGIAAALSGDPAMLAAYKSGDCYLAFAKQAKAVPHAATKQSHAAERERFKQCALAVNYGMEAEGLAARINQPVVYARQLLGRHRDIYWIFWRWSDGAVDHAVLSGSQHTVFGWPNHVLGDFNPRSLRNFHMQGNGAEMMRLACCLGIEAGVEICAPVHDALLICAPLDQLDDDIRTMRSCMAEASRIVTGGLVLETDAKLIRHPDHFSDPRGDRMWREVDDILCQIQ